MNSHFAKQKRHLKSGKLFTGFFALQIVIACGCSKISGPKSESINERYRREAKSEMIYYCTNMVGFQRISGSIFLMDWDKSNGTTTNISLWEGMADVDYINKVGGVERVHVDFKFQIETNQFLTASDKTEIQLDYHRTKETPLP